MALAGYGLIDLYLTSHYSALFWAILIFSYVLIPLFGLALLIKAGYLKDMHVYDRNKRNLSYPLALFGTIVAWLYLNYTYTPDLPAEYLFRKWAYAINFTVLGIWGLNAVWIKISAHMAGVGGFAALTTYLVHHSAIPKNWVIPALVLLAVVYLARKGLSAHSHIELIAGMTLGFIATFAVLKL